MGTLEALLSGVVADPREETRWLVLAGWLEKHDDPRRGELLRLHRRLLATCLEPAAHPERAAWQARVGKLLKADVEPCGPFHTLELPGGVPLPARSSRPARSGWAATTRAAARTSGRSTR